MLESARHDAVNQKTQIEIMEIQNIEHFLFLSKKKESVGHFVSQLTKFAEFRITF